MKSYASAVIVVDMCPGAASIHPSIHHPSSLDGRISMQRFDLDLNLPVNTGGAGHTSTGYQEAAHTTNGSRIKRKRTLVRPGTVLARYLRSIRTVTALYSTVVKTVEEDSAGCWTDGRIKLQQSVTSHTITEESTKVPWPVLHSQNSATHSHNSFSNHSKLTFSPTEELSHDISGTEAFNSEPAITTIQRCILLHRNQSRMSPPHLHITCQVANHGRVVPYFLACRHHPIATATRLTINSATDRGTVAYTSSRHGRLKAQSSQRINTPTNTRE